MTEDMRSKERSRRSEKQKYYGAYNDVDPPLPIPNREVKRICADDTGLTRLGK